MILDQIKNIAGYYNEYVSGKMKIPTGDSIATIAHWRGRFFARIMAFILPLGLVAYIPSQIMSFRDELYFLATFNTIALATVAVAFFACRLNLQWRMYLLMVTLYLLGFILLLTIGWGGPGLVYLLGFSVFATLIVSSRVGYITLIANAVAIGAFAIASYINPTEIQPINNLNHAAILTIGTNFILINLTLVATVSSLVKVLQKKLDSERQVQAQLKDEMEKHKLAKEKAQDSDRLKSVFLANMSHEIRTPMNSILGFTKYLQKPNIPPEKQQQFLLIVEESGKRLLAMINDLLDISKIETGQMPVIISPVDIDSQLQLLYDQFEPEAREKGLAFTRKNPESPVKGAIKTDRGKLYSVLINLLKNAIKYTETGSIEFGYQVLNSKLRFYVSDTGIGIPSDKLDAVFERFIQTDEAIASPYEGTGLGLAIAKAYVEMLNGNIWVESEFGKGSTFIFTITYDPA